jgi:hypothetical protein
MVLDDIKSTLFNGNDAAALLDRPRSSLCARVVVSNPLGCQHLPCVPTRWPSYPLEHNLVNADRTTVAAVAAEAGQTEDLLRAALIVRRDVGRVSDVVHATVMSLLLPAILEEGEVVTNRPSLGAGNDSSRPYDLETNRRVAEFKVSMWSGGDMMRKRTLTADLVHLASDESGRRPELWVAGDEPVRFLRTSTSSVGELLSRSSHHLRDRYQSR